MASKNTYRIGTDGLANWATFAEVPASVLTQGNNTILVYPGTYTAPTAANWSSVAVIGVGNAGDVVISGDTTLANTTSGTTTFENITFTGSNAAVAAAAACVTKTGIGSAPIHFKRCVFGNATYAVSHEASQAQATTTTQVIMDNCDATAVDQTVLSVANAEIKYSALNSGSNAYFTAGSGSTNPTVTVTASTSGGANATNTVKTVTALLT